jgi:hypothetical protein
VHAKLILTVCITLIFVAILACGPANSQVTPTPETPPVVQLMPNLQGYEVVEAETIQSHISNLAEGGALLVGHPELAVLVDKVDDVIACYREVGAVNARIYTDQEFALSSGVIAIADRNRLADPTILFRCIGGQVVPFSSEPELNPCSHSYTLERDNNEFYIIFAGTTQEICDAFCANLEECLRR